MMPTGFHCQIRRGVAGIFLFLAASVCIPTTTLAQPGQPAKLVTGANTNIGGGPAELTIAPTFRVRGDLLRKAQNEPSCGMSTRNPQHILCGANDYRMVDVPGISITSEVRDAWLGEFQSIDGGDTWESTVHKGFFLDSSDPNHPLKLNNFRAAADPTVRTGPAGSAFFSGIAFSGPDRDEGAVFVTTYMDLNNRENDRMPFKAVRTVLVERGNAGQFIDKPWMFVEANGGSCTLQVPLGDGTTVTQTIPGSTVHLLYSTFVGNTDVVYRTKEMYSRSTDCGATFSKPVKVSESMAVNNGSSIGKPAVLGSNRVYGVWRRFKDANSTDAIVAIVSDDNGATWTKAGLVADICPWDQATSKVQFRATDFPSMAVDADGRAYVLWTDRGRDPATNACDVLGKARILMSSSTDGVNWSSPAQVIPSASSEHQIWPTVAFTAGKLVLAWVDFKDDASGVFGKWVNEKEAAIVTPPIRHTGDVRVAMADPGPAAGFATDTATVSRYLKGVGTVNGQKIVGQIQWNAQNKRWAKKGTVPFDGDYLDIAIAPYLPPAPGQTNWRPNNGKDVTVTPDVLIAWTDNRDMRRVPDENLTVDDPAAVPYVTPLGLGDALSSNGTSIVDPSQSRQVCTPGTNNFATGTMNQNVYVARATREFIASSPGTNKPLGTIQRAFVITVRNDTDLIKQFTAVATQPANGTASFAQFDPSKSSVTYYVPRHSSVAKTVFITPMPGQTLDPHAIVPVTVTEVVGAVNGQSTVVYLNSDPSAPEIDSPEIDSPEIDSHEVYTPEIDSPEIDSPEIDSPEIDSPEIDSPEIDSPEIDSAELLSMGIQTPEIDSPEIDSPEIDSPEIDSPEIDSPEIDSSALDDASVTDFKYKIQNKGNTTAQYKAKAFIPNAPAGNYQVIVRRPYAVPTVNAECVATTQYVSKVAVNILNSDVSSPEIDSSALDTASFYVAPGETVDFVIRVRTAAPLSLTEAQALAQRVELAVQPEAVNSDDAALGITEPPIFTSYLSIADSQLPWATVGVPYSRTLQISGAVGAVTWVANGTLPTGLTLTAGTIAGTPQEAGTFTFTIQAQDSATPVPQTASKAFTLVVTGAGGATFAFVTEPSDTRYGETILPSPSVRLMDASGTPLAGIPVTVSLGSNPSGATLMGILNAVTGATGVAAFGSLRVSDSGSYTLVASAASYGSVTSIPFTVTGQPDLVVQSLTHSPAFPTIADTITLTAVVRNQGQGPAGPSTLLFKISGETDGAAGTLYAVPALAAGSSFTIERQLHLGAGAYTSTATADFSGALTESIENNNTIVDDYTVVTAHVPMTFTVTTTNDSGPGSLRQALLDANANAGATDIIVFSIPGPAPHTIAPLSALPVIAEAVVIDAPAAGDCDGNPPTIEIDGAAAGAGVSGLVVTSGGATIRGLAITGFGGNGILLQTGGNNTIECNYMGLRPDGTTADRNDGNGIHIIDSPTNTIGGTTVAVRNVVSANGGEGIRIDGAPATGNVVRGNYVGTDAAGVADLGNALSGIYVRRAPANSISDNVVSGNDGWAGVAICGNVSGCGGGDFGTQGNTAAGTVIQRNLVGTSAAGSAALGNSQRGISIDGAPGTVVGGAANGNVIAANGLNGVVIFGVGATGNTIAGNYIGTDATGSSRMGNTGAGVLVTAVSNNVIGGTASGTGNVISSNDQGILIELGAADTLVAGNRIGTDVSGTIALGNRVYGVVIQNGPVGTIIGGSTPEARNVISGNGSETLGTGVGIRLVSAGAGTVIKGNFIGTDVSGTNPLQGALADGIDVFDTPDSTIGGDAPGEGNLISGNGRAGIRISGSTTTGTTVSGNRIGTNAAGNSALGNGSGIEIDGGSANTLVGGTTAGARNVISANAADGIRVGGSNGNDILGNYIGTDVSGAIDLGNVTYGVSLAMASGNRVGSAVQGGGNVISGNATGVEISDGATGNYVQGNTVGLNADGTAALGNSDGVVIRSEAVPSTGNVVGGTTAAARNVIAGNVDGVVLYGTGATGNQVLGNYIGINRAGNAAVGSSTWGVLITTGARENTIGGTDAGAGNVISGHSQAGIGLNNATANRIQGNLIGLNAAGNTALANAVGVVVGLSSTSNVIGGTAAGAGNVISGNTQDGIRVAGAGTTDNQVLGNRIGTDPGGTAALANGGAGILIQDAANNVIGGTAGITPGGPCTGACNLISGNNAAGGSANAGVYLSGASAITIQGNYIGTDVSGTGSLPNFLGINAEGGGGHVIGGSTAAARNLISGNANTGVRLSGSDSNVVQGNYIGVDRTGAAGVGNGNQGLRVDNAVGNIVGGAAAGEGNVISANGSEGVRLLFSATLVQGNFIGTDAAGTLPLGNGSSGVRVYGNRPGNHITADVISNNGGIGIDLDVDGASPPDGVTPNDDGDADSGPNELQNFPILGSVTSVSGTTTVNGTLSSTPNTQFVLEFFSSPACDPSGHGEGQMWVGSAIVNTDATGNVSFTQPFSVGLADAMAVTATATTPANSTSEFSNCVLVNQTGTVAIQSVTLTSTVLTIDGAAVPYTATLVNGTGSTVAPVVYVQGYIDQGTASRAANGADISCGGALGEFPPGTCSFPWTVAASNQAAGTGTLVAGGATARFELRRYDPATQSEVVLDTFRVAVTLVVP